MTLSSRLPTTRFGPGFEATAPVPPERRGVSRDRVRLLVARTPTDLIHGEFRNLPGLLEPGDLVVVNTSATVAAELDGTRRDRSGHGAVVVHLANPLDDGTWVVELRTAPEARRPVLDADPGERIDCALVRLTLLQPYPGHPSSPTGAGSRLWRASVDGDLQLLLHRRGRPISYGHLPRRFPLSDYQTVFGRDPGSAEMASAGRPFTTALVTELVTRGVGVVPVTLHTGVSSQEAGESPVPERFAVPPATADAVNAARRRGSRVVAVGTTVTRAVESAVVADGEVVAARGWTERVVSPDDPARVVDGLVTGWHEPRASHLLLVESIAGPELTQTAYDAAVAHGYLWHEFGDSCLLLPPTGAGRR